jgi:hypothetical protein
MSRRERRQHSPLPHSRRWRAPQRRRIEANSTAHRTRESRSTASRWPANLHRTPGLCGRLLCRQPSSLAMLDGLDREQRRDPPLVVVPAAKYDTSLAVCAGSSSTTRSRPGARVHSMAGRATPCLTKRFARTSVPLLHGEVPLRHRADPSCVRAEPGHSTPRPPRSYADPWVPSDRNTCPVGGSF